MMVEHAFGSSANSTGGSSDSGPLISPLAEGGQLACSNLTVLESETSAYDALMYIVVVLLFYALSMVILMVKYIRREREEAEMAQYYSEFVSRDRFQAPKFQNQQFMRILFRNEEGLNEEEEEEDEDFVSCSDVKCEKSELKSLFIIGEESKI